MIDLDTESCGLTGPCVLIQYSIDEGPIILHEVFNQPIYKTLRVIDKICENDICGFNLVHDWFILTKLYNILAAVDNKISKPVPEIFLNSDSKRRYMLKPKSALDLFLHARKGPWQSLMERDDIKIKRVPLKIAQILCDILKDKFKLPLIYFARASNPITASEWKVDVPIDGSGDPEFPNIILKFRPSMGLKVLASEIFKSKQIDYPIPKEWYPYENDYNPYLDEWQKVLPLHIKFWNENKTARSYAEQDVLLLQRLRHYWGDPEFGDDDSELACHVGSVRWHGFAIDTDKICSRASRNLDVITDMRSKLNFNSHHEVRAYLKQEATESEKMLIRDTSKKTLEVLSELESPLSIKAKQILNIRRIAKENDVFYKLIETGRFCPNFKIIGAKSGRMSGGFEKFSEDSNTGSLNPQGIKRDKDFRELFLIKDGNESLSGGDFKSYEVTLADAVYKDKQLRADLLEGKSVHAVLGEMLYDKDYDIIIESKNLPKDENLYNPAKNSFFGLLYGAHEEKTAETANVEVSKAREAYTQFINRYPNIGVSRRMISDAFCSMTQPNGIGSAVIWKKPAEYVSTLLGFRRYFTLENKIVGCLYNLAQNPPEELLKIGKVKRKDREQTYSGAAQSALYAAAFQIQARNMRAAANHVIQGTGAQILKKLQRNIIDIIPYGITRKLIKTLNIHDELLVTHQIGYTKTISDNVKKTIEFFKEIVPLLDIDWKNNLKNWGEKE